MDEKWLLFLPLAIVQVGLMIFALVDWARSPPHPLPESLGVAGNHRGRQHTGAGGLLPRGARGGIR